MSDLVNVASAWMLGLSMGLTACTVTCLPFMGTWVMARERTLVMADTFSFLAGRVSAYTLLGLTAALASAWLAQILKAGVGNLAIGAVSILAGAWLLFGLRSHRACGASHKAALSPFALGFSLSLTPCAPLASLLAFSAQSSSPLWGAVYGMSFGSGAAVTPLLLLLPLLSRFGQQLRTNQAWLTRWLSVGAGLVLIALGIRRLMFF